MRDVTIFVCGHVLLNKFSKADEIEMQNLD